MPTPETMGGGAITAPDAVTPAGGSYRLMGSPFCGNAFNNLSRFIPAKLYFLVNNSIVSAGFAGGSNP
jgi:hypothetical protein